MRIAIGVLLVTVACGGSSGRLANKQRVLTGMVKDRDMLLIESGNDHVQMRVDGTDLKKLWPRTYSIKAMVPDGSVVVLGDSDTNLFVANGLGASPRRITALDGRASNATVRADGLQVAATRHADFDTPQSEWSKTEDNAVYLVDVKTLAVDVIPKTSGEQITSMWWYVDGTALYMETFASDKYRLELATRTRTKLPADPPRSELSYPKRHNVCEHTGATLAPHNGTNGDEGIDLVDKSGSARHLIVIEGRSRGFHDYQSTIREYGFTKSCDYVVFDYVRAIWVVDVASGEVAKLMDGDSARILD
jgi:hypothetical protein